MAVRRPKLPALAATAALVLTLAAAGCAGGNTDRSGAQPTTAASLPPGFSADTATRDGLVSGATATEAGCRALPDRLWVHAGWQMRALEWQPTVNVLGLWGADGMLTNLGSDYGERRIAELRWQVEGDRL